VCWTVSLFPQSSVITMAFIHRYVSVDQTLEACRIEEEFQIEENGFVEDGHDTTRAFVKVNLTSVSAFLWLLPASRAKAL
jgi:chaperone required for assembly of F1-ATPase